MPVRVIYDPDCDQNFPRLYHTQFQQWINNNPTHTTQNGEVVVFDEAYVLNGLHPTTSVHDPDPSPHVTVRLSDPSLRNRQAWYVLHWRPDNGRSMILRRTDDEPSNQRRRRQRKEKKKRRRARKKEREKKDKDKKGKDDPSGGDGSHAIVNG
ncbi:hypothetical protein DTO271D3_3835 [Paecilomyces variotii]|nr:hypothetical protein DTO271D3_3835 [Paecilomyces variotii]KAJ9363667.1 hypothetical protein DTO280E4_2257 [Paecilomyces variotii]KAJ9386361.1 hypothetical protein DTO063F5_3624 [Paecilomyces variotii]